MQEIITWLKNNYEWLFGGIGVTVVVSLVGLFFKKKEVSINQKQKSSANSTNIQIGQISDDKN